MEAPEENQESAVESVPEPQGVGNRLKSALSGGARRLGQWLRKLGLLLFIAVTPVLITGYPGYLIVARLADYSGAEPVEAKLTHFEIRTVEAGQDPTSFFESRKHIDVIFYFRDEQGKQFASVIEKSWPSPGLKRKLGNDYEEGDLFTLYRLPDQRIVMDEEVARDSFVRLTSLMALIFVGFVPLFLIWRRLAVRLPDLMPHFPSALAKSMMIGQLVTLLITTMMAVIVAHAPNVVVPTPLYLGAYWAIAAFLTLALRLLVFEEPAPPPAPEPEPEEERGRR